MKLIKDSLKIRRISSFNISETENQVKTKNRLFGRMYTIAVSPRKNRGEDNLIIEFKNNKRYCKFEISEETAQTFQESDVWWYWRREMFLLKNKG